jgi:hypothetical protein
MIKTSVFLLALLNASAVFAGCLSDSQLQQLTEKETTYLSEKIPPAFKHALADKAVKVAVEAIEGEGCKAKLVLTLPQADIDEANAVLDAQPAKKIMLGAQGYALPQEQLNMASFTVDPASLEIPNADILQTAPYGKLRASVELMYSFITQKRSNLSEGQANDTPWPEALTTQVVTSCSSQAKAVDCSCVAKQYTLSIPARQMAYILSNEENPYAMGAGANQGFKAIKQKAFGVCKR